jgi:colanic acid biosynthesis glycosyl transferase WcaI
MNVLLVNQYFPPDGAPTGLMLERVAKQLVDLGHEVTILCAKGGYAQTDGKEASDTIADLKEPKFRVVRIGGTRFGRGTFLGKIGDYAFFYLGVARHLTFIKPRPDRIVALTSPPYLSILARFFSKVRGGNHSHWVMDLYPDVMVAHGMLKPTGIAVRFLNRLTLWGFGGKRCKMVVTLGPDMEERTAKHLSPGIPRQWVPLWGAAEGPGDQTSHGVDRESSEGALGDDKVVLMYSGNMGLGHRFGEFLEVAANAGPQFQWKFHGQGKRRIEVERFLKENPEAPVTLGDYVPREELAAHLAAADVHLASLNPVWDGTMVPSKLQGIFAIGRPVIFIGSEDCAIGSWIQESDGGWVVPPRDLQALEKALHESLILKNREEKGRNAQDYAKRHFQAKQNAEKIAKYLIKL